jgi:hypothetical protein
MSVAVTVNWTARSTSPEEAVRLARSAVALTLNWAAG